MDDPNLMQPMPEHERKDVLFVAAHIACGLTPELSKVALENTGKAIELYIDTVVSLARLIVQKVNKL